MEAGVSAQPALNRYIKKINSDDGLSHNIVNDIVQDPKGFLWIATHDGLNRFDGYEFKVYRFNPSDSTSILGNYIKSLFVDQKGNLWVSTRYGLNLYNSRKDNFIGFTPDQNENLDITKIAASSDGGLWISNYTGGFLHFHPENKSFTIYNIENQALPTNFIMSIHEDSDNVLWVGTGDYGVLVFRHENTALDILKDLTDKLKEFDVTQIVEIFADNNSNIWIASRQGVLFYNRSLNEFFQIKKTDGPYGLSGNIILDISQDYQGNILIGTQEGGLNILSQDQLKANHPRTFKFSKTLPGSERYNLSYRSIQSIYEDKDRNIWLGTFGSGINLIPSVQPRFKLLEHSEQNPNTLNFDKIWGICEDQEGLLWIGTDGMGLNRCNFITGEIAHYYSGNRSGDLSDDAILCALCDSRGRLWFGTYAGGLNLYNKNTDSFINVRVRNERNGLTVNDIRCIFEAGDGHIWLGTNGAGLMKLDPDQLTFENIIPETTGFSAFDIRAITQDNSGGLWLGTYGAGLFYYHPGTRETKHFMFDRVNPGSLKCNIIYSLLFNSEKNHLWIGGSQNGGLNLLDLNNFTFSLFDHNMGLANNIIHGIEKDGKGRLWVSTNAGISLFDTAAKEFTNFDKLDGVQEKEFSNGSVLKSSFHNIICFGGTAGLNYFNADNIEKRSDQTSVLITDLKIFNRDVPLKSRENGDSPLINTILYTDNIQLNHKQNNFTLGFSGFHYSNPDKIKYQYKLENADQDWNDLQFQRSITFQNLKAGEYEFKVRASNEDGQWADTYESLLIDLKPPPWKSWWAYVLYGLLVVSFIIWIYYYNLKEAKMRHNLLLEKKLRLQEHDLYEERIRFFTNISHELRSPLMLLINPLEELITKESLNTRLGRTFNNMYRSANSLLLLINTLLEFRRTETGNLSLSAGKYNIVEQVEETSIAFRGMAARKNILLSFESDDNVIEAWYDREKLEMILNNILSNAIKNSFENKAVSVHIMKDQDPSARFREGSVTIQIRDEGRGIPENEIDKIFERFYQVKDANNIGGTGIGLALAKKLVELHRGTIHVESKVNQGTSFSILLPLGNSHFSEEDRISETTDKPAGRTTFIDKEDTESINLILEKLSSLSPEKRKVLVIDDNQEIRIYLNDLLNDHFIIEEAADGISGLEKARKINPSVIISDIMMPGMDGLELCKNLKSELETSHIPILMITANLSHHVHINSFEVGADAYITKPFKPDLLLSRIYNLLKSREKLFDYYLDKFKSGLVSEKKALNKDEEFSDQGKRTYPRESQ
jgi:signal transduction histidine kinase/ligand-binding sensor domain-containing protein/DNA-binding NarL/FixJ family response regulator